MMRKKNRSDPELLSTCFMQYLSSNATVHAARVWLPFLFHERSKQMWKSTCTIMLHAVSPQPKSLHSLLTVRRQENLSPWWQERSLILTALITALLSAVIETMTCDTQ